MIEITVSVTESDDEGNSFAETIVTQTCEDSWKENSEDWPSVMNRAIRGHYGYEVGFELVNEYKDEDAS